MQPWLSACENGHLSVRSTQRTRGQLGVPCFVCWPTAAVRHFPIEDKVVLAIWHLAGIEAAREAYLARRICDDYDDRRSASG